jgi:hypothetical protein
MSNKREVDVSGGGMSFRERVFPESPGGFGRGAGEGFPGAFPSRLAGKRGFGRDLGGIFAGFRRDSRLIPEIKYVIFA